LAAAAGGADAVTVDDPDALPGVLKDALAVVNGGRVGAHSGGAEIVRMARSVDRGALGRIGL